MISARRKRLRRRSIKADKCFIGIPVKYDLQGNNEAWYEFHMKNDQPVLILVQVDCVNGV